MESKAIVFNRKERAGILFLVIITVLLQLAPGFIPRKEITISYSKFSFPGSESLKTDTARQGSRYLHSETSYFHFDPNTASKEEWISMGVKERIAGNIIKYRSKGGVFRQPADLEKIWGLDKQQLVILKKYAVIKRPEDKPLAEKRSQKPAIIIEINTADSAMFESLPGIGAKLAGRIINYRHKLGGFHSMQQLKEVYGLKDSLLQKALPFMTVRPLIRRLNINEANEDEIRSHPYLRPMAKVIVAYRFQHGHFSSADDLRHIMIMTDSMITRIRPYISTE